MKLLPKLYVCVKSPLKGSGELEHTRKLSWPTLELIAMNWFKSRSCNQKTGGEPEAEEKGDTGRNESP